MTIDTSNSDLAATALWELVIEFNSNSRVLPLQGRRSWDIGRPTKERKVEIDLSPDLEVSRLHARLTRDGNGVWLEDLGSLSGTRVAGADIRRLPLEPRRVLPDEIIEIGQSILRWRPSIPEPETKDDSSYVRPGSTPMELTPRQIDELVEALTRAFNRESLEEMLVRRLGIVLENEVDARGKFTAVLTRLVQAIQHKGWAPTIRFIAATVQTRPENERLIRFAQSFNGLIVAATPELERQVVHAIPHLDIPGWLQGLVRMQSRVCRVTVSEGKSIYHGTGFLVAPDLLLTNYHVIDSVVEKPDAPQRVKLLFDYTVLEDRTAVDPGKSYELAPTDWLVAHSPPSPLDTMPDPQDTLPSINELDYALLRLSQAAGADPVNPDRALPDAPPRGWIELPELEASVQLEPNDPLFIIQHAEGGPVKLALNTQSIEKVNGNRTRVRYRTNTDPGSSGAPCFDIKWNLIALHHSGDSGPHTPKWNEGIPIDTIASQVRPLLVRQA